MSGWFGFDPCTNGRSVDLFRSAGGKNLGEKLKTLDVVRIAYPDKTDYIVEVESDGQRGFVKDGLFRLIEGVSRNKKIWADDVAERLCSVRRHRTH